MASLTRSGRLLKHGEVGSSGSESVAGKGKDVKGTSASCPAATNTKSRVQCRASMDVKGRPASGSAATDSSSLRRSTRESPSKKTREPSLSSRKLDKLEKDVPCVTSSKNMREPSPSSRIPERLEMSAPLVMWLTPNKKTREPSPSSRKSERLEMEAPLATWLTPTKKMGEPSPSSRKSERLLKEAPLVIPTKRMREPSPSSRKSERFEKEAPLVTPTKKMKEPSPSSRKSERLEKDAPLVTPTKKMREPSPSSRKLLRLEKEAPLETSSKDMSEPSPSLRRPERLEKEGPLETPSKKMREPSSNSRKLERMENEAPSTPPDKKKVEKVDKQRPRSAGRSPEIIGKHGTPGSSSSKNTQNCSSSSGKKRNNCGSGKITISDSEEQSRSKHQDVKSSGLKVKKKMNARRYRALLNPSQEKAKCRDADNMKMKDDSASGRISCDSRSILFSGFKEVHKDGGECKKIEEELRWKHSDNNSKEAMEISSPDSRQHAELTLKNDEGRESIHLRGEGKFKGRPPVVNSNDSFPELSEEKEEVNGEADRFGMHNLAKGKLEAPELVPSTCEGKTATITTTEEFGGSFGRSKSEKMVADLDSDISVTPVNREFTNPDSSTIDAALSCSLGSKSKNRKQCAVCCKPLRLQDVGSSVVRISVGKSVLCGEFSAAFSCGSIGPHNIKKQIEKSLDRVIGLHNAY